MSDPDPSVASLPSDPEITRRDFVGGTLVGTGAALLAMASPGAVRTAQAPTVSSKMTGLGPDWTGPGGIGDYARSNGNTHEVVHTIVMPSNMNSTQFTSQPFFALAARALLALIFLVMGCRHGVHRSRVAADLAAHGMPHTRVLIVAAILIELVGGSSLLLGFGARWAAAALALFTILATLIYYRSVSDPEHLAHLLKNLAIVGGLLMVACCGPGPLRLGGDV